MMDKNMLRSFILSVVKPLKPGKVVSSSKDKAGLSDLYPEGGFSDKFRLTSPFGFIAGLPTGITAFYQSLFGSGHESIILALLHSTRPEPSGPGETVLYSTDSSGQSIQVKIVLGTDGTLTITSPTKVVVNSPDVELGSGALESVLNGATFQTYFNTHSHSGNLGSPTGPPITPSDASHLSQIVKAAK